MIDCRGPYPSIAEYAIIGDCRSAALISRGGSLDWLCWPRFDSPSLFAALLDARAGGRFRVCPAGEFDSSRRYLPDTNVLETVFHCAEGAFALRDCMPVSSEEDKRVSLTPDHEVLREIECIEGQVRVEVAYQPRPDYATARFSLRRRGALGVWCTWRRGALVLASDLPMDVEADGHSASASVVISSGERRYLSLTYEEELPAVIPTLGDAARARIDRSVRWWREWAGRCQYDGSYREEVVRSALALKLLAYAPSGAVIAAPTTSLPEWPGSERNWDYRYCWLRDASLTLRSLFALGHRDEAQAFLSWILQATRLTWPELQVVYDVYGEAKLAERSLPQFEGYKQSAPVRIGNAAHDQLQLDVYGEVADAAAQFTEQGGKFDRDTRKLLSGLGETVCRRWSEPDDGIWEPRAPRAHHTHSKVLCWVALDRLIQMCQAGHLDVPVEHFREVREEIRATIEAHGYNAELESFVSVLDGREVDASLLALPFYGYLDAADPRMRSTIARVRRILGRDDLIYRYPSGTDDGLPPGEGAFGICSFWAVECLALAGAVAEAHELFERLSARANDVGLLSEEIDPKTGMLLGNFPQAFTHVGLINAAITLAEREREREREGGGGDAPAPPVGQEVSE